MRQYENVMSFIITALKLKDYCIHPRESCPCPECLLFSHHLLGALPASSLCSVRGLGSTCLASIGPQPSEGPSRFTMSPDSGDLSELRAELVEFWSQVIWGLLQRLLSRVRRFSEGQGLLGFTFPVLTSGPVPLPSL